MDIYWIILTTLVILNRIGCIMFLNTNPSQIVWICLCELFSTTADFLKNSFNLKPNLRLSKVHSNFFILMFLWSMWWYMLKYHLNIAPRRTSAKTFVVLRILKPHSYVIKQTTLYIENLLKCQKKKRYKNCHLFPFERTVRKLTALKTGSSRA